MSTFIRTAGGTIIAAIAVAILFNRSDTALICFAQGKAAPMMIDVNEIGTKVILVGRLKSPLATLMTVNGKWSIPQGSVRDSSPRFTVSHVDGVKLDKPVEFNIAQVDVTFENLQPRQSAIPKFEDWQSLDGVSWTLQAYETGRFRLTPQLKTGYYQSPYWYETFTTELVGVLPE
jgi:hypothetical protein